MSDLFSMLISAHVQDSVTGELVGLVTGVETMGNRMRVRVAFFPDDDDIEEDDPEREDIPEETIVEKIRAISGERKT